jgi:PIN like domain
VKVLIDENLPPALAKALNALFAGDHEVIHLRERFGPRVTDAQWIAALNEEGRWVIISGDRRIRRNPAEYYTFRNSRLVGFFLSPGLNKAKLTKQMERLLALWETIDAQASIVRGGAMFVLPMKSTRLEQLR